MTLRDDDTLMLAYVYGELESDEVRAFEQRLEADPGLRAEVDGLLATRELLVEDARYGEASGVDLPPAHLTDAILRAEVLARPPEIRQAHARGASGGFLARIQLWFVGGGLAVAAAAALLLVVKEGSTPAPDMAAPAAESVPKQSEAQRPAAGMAKEGTGQDALPRGAVAEAEPEAAATFADAPAEPLAEATASGLAEEVGGLGKLSRDGARSSGGAGRGTLSDPALEEKPQKAAEQRAEKQDKLALPTPPLEALGAGDAEGFAPADAEEDAADRAPAKDAAKAKQKPGASLDEDIRGGRLERAAEASEHKREQPVLQQGPARGMTTSGSSTSVAPSPSAAPPAPPALPDVVRRQLAKKRSARSRAPARQSAKPGTELGQNNERFDALQLTLVTAERELSAGRALEALDLFTSVTRQDPRGALMGVVPYVGRMRALQALTRHAEVLALLPTVKRPGIQATGVPEGLLVAARSAEALGDFVLARQLYRELLVVKEQRKEAEAALARLDADPRVRSNARYDDALEAEAAPAAASEPRGKN